MSYEYIKSYILAHRTEIKIVISFVIIFLVGIGVGRFQTTGVRNAKTSSSQSHYTTKPTPTVAGLNAELQTETTTEPTNTSTKDTQPTPKPVVANNSSLNNANGSCIIKGNISSTSKIYHVKVGAFYDRVKPEQCFNTEAEAKSAGFRKSSR